MLSQSFFVVRENYQDQNKVYSYGRHLFTSTEETDKHGFSMRDGRFNVLIIKNFYVLKMGKVALN